jgi:Cupin domain
MPKASKHTASESFSAEGYEGRFAHFDGGYSVGFETYTADADPAPLFKGLPDDRCQCPHWGYVVKGKVKYTFADGQEETYEAGDAYYAPPGHIPHLYAGSEVVEFHPTSELAKTMEVVSKNVASMGA